MARAVANASSSEWASAASVAEALEEERCRCARLEADLAAARAAGAAVQTNLDAVMAQRTDLEREVCAQATGKQE